MLVSMVEDATKVSSNDKEGRIYFSLEVFQNNK